jgi:hypothetical protein
MCETLLDLSNAGKFILAKILWNDWSPNYIFNLQVWSSTAQIEGLQLKQTVLFVS